MKLLVVHQHYVVKHYQELLVAASRQNTDLDVEILCPTVFKMGRKISTEALEPDRVPVHTLAAPFARQGRQHLFFYIGLGALLDRVRPDVVWAQEANSLVTAQVCYCCKKRNIPVILLSFKNHRKDYKKTYGYLNPRRYMFPFCESYTFKNCAGIVAIDNLVKDVLRQDGFKGKIHTQMTMGVNSLFFDVGKARLQKGAEPSDSVKIGFVGGLFDYKGIDILLRAFKNCHAGSAVLTIRGNGPEEANLKHMTKELGLEPKVCFESFVPFCEVPRIMGELDILVLPSVKRGAAFEQFGRVIVEAQAAGTVVVGSNLGGIPYAMSGGGFLFEPGNDQELAYILNQLCSDSDLRQEYQKLGYETVKNTFSDEVLAGKFVEGLRSEFGLL